MSLPAMIPPPNRPLPERVCRALLDLRAQVEAALREVAEYTEQLRGPRDGDLPDGPRA